MPCSLRIRRRAYSLPLYSPFHIVKDCWEGTLDNPLLLNIWCPCCWLTSAVWWALMHSWEGYTHLRDSSTTSLLASNAGTKAVRSLLSSVRVAGKSCCLGACDSGELWKACVSLHMQVVPLGWWRLLSALRCQPTTVLTSPMPSPETVLAPVGFLIPDPWSFILNSELMPCEDCLCQLHPSDEVKIKL